MFGYIGVCKPELKIKEFETFRAYYCGLCHALNREYSASARFILNYDCAFLYVLSDALKEGMPVYNKQRCMVHPFRERHTTDGCGAEYAAAVNVLLAYESLNDHVSDDGSALGRVGMAALSGAYKKARMLYPDLSEYISNRLAALKSIELKGSADVDAAANEFALILEEVFSRLDPSCRPLRTLGHELGRWIYLIDALDDFKKDAKSGSYNPFVARFGGNYTQEVRECAEFNLNSSVTGAALALDLMEFKKHEGIIKNIIYLGLYDKMKQVFERTNSN